MEFVVSRQRLNVLRIGFLATSDSFHSPHGIRVFYSLLLTRIETLVEVSNRADVATARRGLCEVGSLLDQGRLNGAHGLLDCKAILKSWPTKPSIAQLWKCFARYAIPHHGNSSPTRKKSSTEHRTSVELRPTRTMGLRLKVRSGAREKGNLSLRLRGKGPVRLARRRCWQGTPQWLR